MLVISLSSPTLVSASACCIQCQDALCCKSMLSMDCAGGEPDGFSFAGRVRRRWRVYVCVPAREMA